MEIKDLVFVICSIFFLASLTFVSGKYLEYRHNYIEVQEERSQADELREQLSYACETINAYEERLNSTYKALDEWRSRFYNISNQDKPGNLNEDVYLDPGYSTPPMENPWNQLDCKIVS